MGIIDDQALDACLYEQLKQQKFAFAPMSPASQSQSGQPTFLHGSKRRDALRRMNLLALAIKLSRLFTVFRNPSALIFGFLDLFLQANPDLLRSGCGRPRLFPVSTALGCGFPLTDPLSHKGWAVGFAHIRSLDKEVNDRDIAAVIIQFQVFALEAV